MTLQYTFIYDADRSSRTNKVNFCYQPLMSRPVLFYNISVLEELSRLTESNKKLSFRSI